MTSQDNLERQKGLAGDALAGAARSKDPPRAPTLPYGTYSTLRKERKEQTRQRLLEAACDLYTKNGLEHVSVDQIVDVAGVSRATFYLHFDTRRDVLDGLRSLVTDRLDLKYDALARLGPDVSHEQLAAWIREFMQTCRDNRRLVYLLICTIPAEGAVFGARGYYASVLARLGSNIPQFRQANFDRKGLWSEAMLLLLQLEAILRHFLTTQDDEDFLNLCDALARSFHRFIQKRAPDI